MGTTLKALYDTDFVEWADHTAALLREGRLSEVDMEHLIEEVEGLGSSERSAVTSQLVRMLMHLIEQRVQPERSGNGWRTSIIDAQTRILVRLKSAPSLRRYAGEDLEDAWTLATRQAIVQTELPRNRHSEIPKHCPYTLDELLEGFPQPW
jgi:Domain of unknown function DUF29